MWLRRPTAEKKDKGARKKLPIKDEGPMMEEESSKRSGLRTPKVPLKG